MNTPYGVRRVTYSDYVASGKVLECVESLIRREVMPYYGNTHTEASHTGHVTTLLREQARARILKSCHADETTKLIFTNSGVTGVQPPLASQEIVNTFPLFVGSINRIIGMLGLRIPFNLNKKYALDSHIPAEERPVVLVSSYEHHSNELPWRETIADIFVVPQTQSGQVLNRSSTLQPFSPM